jgi:hypothetical protein
MIYLYYYVLLYFLVETIKKLIINIVLQAL